jgi:hypothetical protein
MSEYEHAFVEDGQGRTSPRHTFQSLESLSHATP